MSRSGCDEPWDLGVGGVHAEQVDALVAEPGEAAQVGQPTVQRQLVELDVPGVQHGAGRRPDRDRERVRDRVVDREELQVEAADGATLAFGDLDELRVESMLAALGLDQGQGEPGSVHRQVTAQPQQERQRADVVLVTVGDHDRVDVGDPVLHQAQVGQDQVDAGLRVLGEQDAAVDDQQPPVELVDGHVAADLADPTEGDHAQRPGHLAWRPERVGRGHHRPTAGE